MKIDLLDINSILSTVMCSGNGKNRPRIMSMFISYIIFTVIPCHLPRLLVVGEQYTIQNPSTFQIHILGTDIQDLAGLLLSRSASSFNKQP